MPRHLVSRGELAEPAALEQVLGEVFGLDFDGPPGVVCETGEREDDEGDVAVTRSRMLRNSDRAFSGLSRLLIEAPASRRPAGFVPLVFFTECQTVVVEYLA